jgi:hypothetical protein
MEIRKVTDGEIIDAKSYTIFMANDAAHKFTVRIRGQKIFAIPFISGLSTDENETLSDVVFDDWIYEKDFIGCEVSAHSSLWKNRKFHWRFYEEYIEYYHTAEGDKRPEKCFFFSNGVSGGWDDGDSKGIEFNTQIYAKRMFSPKPNLSGQHYYDISRTQSLGIRQEIGYQGAFNTEQISDGLFCPPLMNLCFNLYYDWASIGIGEIPGKYLFNAFEYTGIKVAGASFYVNYQGYTGIDGGFVSPTATIQFAASEFTLQEKYVAWLDKKNFSTQFRFENAPWHRLPIFCGWSEQGQEAHRNGKSSWFANSMATQENYEKWIDTLDNYGLPYGTILIDDKWQAYYGTFDIDTKKWPDLKGFVDKQHAKGKHVLLWVPGHHKEGIPKEFSVLDENDEIVTGDVTNPAYEKFLREKVKYLVKEIGIDGFKEDWVGGFAVKKALKLTKPVIGIEFFRKFQFILHDEAHKWKKDALVETQTPFPLFRESSDMLRLNDLWSGTRDVPDVMRLRAKLANIAGWRLIDCDNASSTHLEMWWEYMLAQPTIGVPSLYIVSETETTHEKIPAYMFTFLANFWKDYIHKYCS